jgi:hypothetical protein
MLPPHGGNLVTIDMVFVSYIYYSSVNIESFFLHVLQCRKQKDLYLWMVKSPGGPSVKFLVNAGMNNTYTVAVLCTPVYNLYAFVVT